MNITGVGLGLRFELFEQLLRQNPRLDFMEFSPENYMHRGGYVRESWLTLKKRYRFLSHGLTLSLGGKDPFDRSFLASLREFLKEAEVPWHSDHLSFGSVAGKQLHDLLPIQFTERELRRIADRISFVQEALSLPIAIENISYYLYPGDKHLADWSEVDFISELVKRTGCGTLLDVNNVYVNSVNFGFDPLSYIQKFPFDSVVQIHVAGHHWFHEGSFELVGDDQQVKSGGHFLIVDTHASAVNEAVLNLLHHALLFVGDVPVLLERDQDIPKLEMLMEEVERIRKVRDGALFTRSRRTEERLHSAPF